MKQQNKNLQTKRRRRKFSNHLKLFMLDSWNYTFYHPSMTMVIFANYFHNFHLNLRTKGKKWKWKWKWEKNRKNVWTNDFYDLFRINRDNFGYFLLSLNCACWGCFQISLQFFYRKLKRIFFNGFKLENSENSQIHGRPPIPTYYLFTFYLDSVLILGQKNIDYVRGSKKGFPHYHYLILIKN